MSAIIRARRNSSPPLSTTVLWLALGLVAVFFLVRYGQQVLLAHDLNDRAAAQRAENAALRDENSRLQAQLNYIGSDKYIEQRAREDLNLRRPDEEVLIPIELPAAETGASTTLSNTATVMNVGSQLPTPEPANWQQWLELFSPAP